MSKRRGERTQCDDKMIHLLTYNSIEFNFITEESN